MEGWYYSLLWRFFLNNFSPYDVFKDIVISIQQSVIALYFDIILVFFFFFSLSFIDWQLRLLSNYLKGESFVGRFFSFKKEIYLSVSFGFIRFYPLQLPNFLSNFTSSVFKWSNSWLSVKYSFHRVEQSQIPSREPRKDMCHE